MQSYFNLTNMENTKICKKCGMELPLECFGKHKRMKDGLQPYCKECMKQYKKQYRAEHAEAIKQYMKQYKKQYYAENREEILEKNKQYNAEHAEAIKQYFKQYFKQRYATIEGYARNIRKNNLRADRNQCRIGVNEDPLPTIEQYIELLQQRDYYDGKQYHWTEMGLDRIDNTKPHTLDNVVPCSTKNNKRRQKMNFEEFCAVMNKKE